MCYELLKIVPRYIYIVFYLNISLQAKTENIPQGILRDADQITQLSRLNIDSTKEYSVLETIKALTPKLTKILKIGVKFNTNVNTKNSFNKLC